MTGRGGLARAACLGGLFALLALGAPVRGRAMDPDHALSQYARERWGTERGFPGGTVQAISQTPDGYLWVGTDGGLFRFDGQAFTPYPGGRRSRLAVPRVAALAADREGSLWITLGGARLLRYREGTLDADAVVVRRQEGGVDTTRLEQAEDAVTAMALGRGGTVLLAGLLNGVLRFDGSRFEPFSANPLVPSAPPIVALGEAPDGTVWAGTRGDGAWRMAGGTVTHVVDGLPDRTVNAVLPIGPRDVWIATEKGVARWNGTEVTSRGLDPLLARPALTLALDRESNVWIGTSRGLLRANAGGVSSLDTVADTQNAVTAIFEDREGSLWIGRRGVLERLRDTKFTTFGPAQGLPSEHNGPVLVDAERRVWFAPLEGGLFWLSRGRVGQARGDGLESDVVYSIAAGDGGVWAARRSGALTWLAARGDSVSDARTYRPAGSPPRAIYSVHQGRDGTVWAGTLGGGLLALRDGRLTATAPSHGLPSDSVTAIVDREDGSVWVATPKGLAVRSNGGWRVFTARDGLPSDEVNCLLDDSAGTLWVGTADGLGLVADGRAGTPPGLPPALREQIFGLAGDRQGWLWIATSRAVVRVRRDPLQSGAVGDGDLVEYGLADGLAGTIAAKRHRSVVADVDGRIWFSMDRGLSVVDPVRAAGMVIPVVSRVEWLSSDGTSIGLGSPARIPPGAHRLTFTYSGVSLSAPDGIRFRYRLDGFDHAWSEPLTAREAVYTNLGPGSYRFRVTASNQEGIWPGSEAALALEVQPTLWQTGSFRLAAALSLLLTLVLFYRLRLRRLTHAMTLRFEDRLAERTRIAQELHDTLLQGFLSASMQLHVAAEEVPASPARRRLEEVLALMGRVIGEGRNAVRGLRSPDDELDLEQAFSRLRQDLRLGDGVDFRVIGEGARRSLHPMIRDDVYRIGREALVNAVRHAQARTIEVAVESGAHQLRVLVRDDGKGIDPDVLRDGRAGHWGLSGMRERAERVGGRLRVWSRLGAGTEVELSVPAHLAFRSPVRPGPLSRLARAARRWKVRVTRAGDSEAGGSR